MLSATFNLAPGNAAMIKADMDDYRQRREDKQPLDMPSAGSPSERPEGLFAGKLIMDAGLRGHAVGGAQVSETPAASSSTPTTPPPPMSTNSSATSKPKSKSSST